MVQDRLLTVNRWNKHKFLLGGDTLSLNGGNTQGQNGGGGGFSTPSLGSSNWGNILGENTGSGLTIQPTTRFTDQFNNWDASNSYNPSGTMRDLKKNLGWRSMADGGGSGFDWGGLGLAAASAALSTPGGDKLLDELDPTYHLAGGRESTVGNAFNSAGKGVFKAGVASGDPWLMLAGAGAKVVGGLSNAAFGSKWNKDNINDVESTIKDMRNTGLSLAGAKSNESILDNWGKMDLGYTFNNNYIGKDGWLTHKVGRKANHLRDELGTAQDYATHALAQGLGNVDKRNNRMVMGNYTNNAAYGGPLDMMGNDMGAIGYGFMNDYLTMKNRQAQGKGSMTGYLGAMGNGFAKGGKIHIDPKNKGKLTETSRRTGKSFEELAHSKNPLTRKRAQFALNARKWQHGDGGPLYTGYMGLADLMDNGDTLFGLGGDLQSNGGDYSAGLLHVDEGGSHESNPYEGVQMGLASDGEPNLVEEGETIFNGYVFSNRLKPTKKVLKEFHLFSKGGKLTYADVSKKLEKEAEERPNDPLSRASLRKQMERLMEAQEEQKAEQEAREVRKAFEALSPEEQWQVLAQIAQMQQDGGEDGGENGGENGGDVPVDENGNPVDATMAQQPAETMEQPTEDVEYAANGGHLGHKYPTGGELLRQAILGALTLDDKQPLYSEDRWNTWAKDNNISNFDFANGWNDWQGIVDNKILMDAVQKANPGLAYAIRHGYGNGYNVENQAIFNPDQNTFNWSHLTAQDAKDSNDAAIAELKKNNFDFSTTDNDAYAKAYEATQPYKDTTKWLQEEANAARYYKALQDPSAGTDPKALNWIDKTFKDNGDGTYTWYSYDPETGKQAELDKYDYSKVFAPVREDHKVGSFYKSAIPASRGANTVDLIDDGNGNVSVATIPIPKEWGRAINSYMVQDKDNDTTYNIYRRPEAAGTAPTESIDDSDRLIPIMKNPYQYAGIVAPALGLGMWAAGIGKPSYVGLDTALKYGTSMTDAATYKPWGNYLTYRPFDVWSVQNAANARSMATDRAIMNNSSPIGTKNAGLLSNSYISQLGTGANVRQAQEANNAQKAQVNATNNAIDQANAEAFNKVSMANAELRNNMRKYGAGLAAEIANQKMNADAQWYNALYQGVGQLGSAMNKKSNTIDQMNMIATGVNSGLFGTPSETFLDGMFPYWRKGSKKSKGGDMKNKGWTF